MDDLLVMRGQSVPDPPIMKEVATLNFIDSDSNDEALINIRARKDLVAIAFSLKKKLGY